MKIKVDKLVVQIIGKESAVINGLDVSETGEDLTQSERNLLSTGTGARQIRVPSTPSSSSTYQPLSTSIDDNSDVEMEEMDSRNNAKSVSAS